jgi:hypothetical protein
MLQDPVSAQQHFMLRRARDDGPEVINRNSYEIAKVGACAQGSSPPLIAAGNSLFAAAAGQTGEERVGS